MRLGWGGRHARIQLSLVSCSGGLSGRFSGVAWWLDSNDTFGIGWTVDIGTAFDVIAFILSDAADMGATLIRRRRKG